MGTKASFIRINALVERYITILTPASLLLGFLFASEAAPFLGAVPYLFAYMMLTTSLGCEWTQVKAAMRSPIPFLWTFAAAHVLLPLLAYGAGSLVYGSGSPYVTGLVLFTLIPLGVTSILWVGLASGRVPLILAFVVLDTVLSPLVVPGAVHLLFGQHVEFDAWAVMVDLIKIVVVPTIVGLSLNHWSKGAAKRSVQPYLSPSSKLALLAVLALNASAIQPYADDLKGDLPSLVPLAIGIIAAGYISGYASRRWFGSGFDDETYSFALGMRNISLGIVIALHYFEPLAAVPVILSTMLQQPLAALNLSHLRRRQQRLISKLPS